MPAIGITLVMLAKDYFIDDKMLWFVLMLMASGPPAVNCMNLTQVTGTFQGEMATLLLYSYVVVGPLMSILVMIMLNLIDKS
jgi:auxin efflux carrier family protein